MQKRINPRQLQDDFIDFVKRAKKKYKVYEAYCDSAGADTHSRIRDGVHTGHVGIGKSRMRSKDRINDRIAFYNSLIAQNRWKVMKHCPSIIEAFEQAVYDEKKRIWMSGWMMGL